MKFLLAYLTVVSSAEKRECKKELDSVCSSELQCDNSGTDGWVIESRNYACTNRTIAKVNKYLKNSKSKTSYQCILCSTGEGKQHYCRNDTGVPPVYDDFDTECQKECFFEGKARFQLLNETEMNPDQVTGFNADIYIHYRS